MASLPWRSWYLFGLLGGRAARVEGPQDGDEVILDARSESASFCLGQSCVVSCPGRVGANDHIDMAVGQRQEVIAVEDVGGDQMASEFTQVTDLGQPVPGGGRRPERASMRW